MNNINSKNCFRKVLSSTQQEQTNSLKFRKSIDNRMATPIKDTFVSEKSYTSCPFRK